ncbi:hypothetical protein ACTQ45_06205 [Fundicoccus sp. Sow4_D5]|uniref:hypothetical protein n=1 Tax=Fundicoccus sp. Sow4_D5 TaxID=3438782 RepID=UPI003F910D74
MLTLKEHYQKVLEGKNEKELKAYSLKIKEEINQLKYEIEKSNVPVLKSPDRSKLSKINKHRLYLRDTYRAIERLGGNVERLEEDMIASKFQDNIHYIQSIKYSIGGYFGGFENYEVTFEKELVEVSKELTLNDFQQLDLENTKEKMGKREFLNTVKRLNMGEWRESYLDRDYGQEVLDGTSWDLEVYYSNGLKSIEFSGVNAFPYNFSELDRLIISAFEAYHEMP